MKILPWLFSFALFTSAVLSFSVQPIFGKMLLPMVGGAPAGWIVAMAFFQLALLAGYGVSYLLSRFSPWMHAMALLALYAFGYTYLPPHLPEQLSSAQDKEIAYSVTKALAQSIFVPFLALTATTAALQRVFAATRHATAQDPYYLFVASNVGSFIGLFAYPLILEPFFGLQVQANSWQTIYAIAIILIIAATMTGWRFRASQTTQLSKAANTSVSARQVLRWLILSFVPCSLSMGVTNLITSDVGGVPLFWVVPLGLYLLTFIIAFARKPIVSTKMLDMCHLAAVMVLIISVSLGVGYSPSFDLIMFFVLAGMLLAVFFGIALSCHRHLAVERPQTQHLTLYYFIIAFGGGLAGLFHAFVVPFILPYNIEFSIMAILSLLLVKDTIKDKLNQPRFKKLKSMVMPATGIAILCVALSFYMKAHGVPQNIYLLPIIVFSFIVMMLSAFPRVLFILGFITMLGGVYTYYPGDVLMRTRNFFGTMVVFNNKIDEGRIRLFVHGNTVHGMQMLDAEKPGSEIDIGYYGQNGPISDVIHLAKGKNLAVIGLGAGVLACYDKSFAVDFYEIDPDVERIARDYFSYLKDCPARNVIIGDGRLKLKHSSQIYNVILEDAFNSDGIPMHLITTEALQLYQTRLDPHGLLLFHISNRYLDLAPQLAAIAKAQGLQAYYKHRFPTTKKPNAYTSESRWVSIPMSDEEGTGLLKAGWQKIESNAKAWTDDRSSLIEAVNMPWNKVP